MSEDRGKGVKAMSKHRAGSSCDSSVHSIQILVIPISSLTQCDTVLFQPRKT